MENMEWKRENRLKIEEKGRRGSTKEGDGERKIIKEESQEGGRRGGGGRKRKGK